MAASYRQIAKEAGVSTTTVHRILTGANKEVWPSSLARAEKVRKIAEKYGFRPNAAARSMRLKKTDTIGVVVKYLAGRVMIDPSLFEVIMGISYVLENNGKMMNLVRIHDDFSKQNVPRAFKENLLDGVIVLGDMPDNIYDYISSFYKYYAFVETNRFDKTNCIRRDETMTVRLAVENLIQNGRKKLIYCGPIPESESAHFSEKLRMEHFRKRTKELSVDANVIRTTNKTYENIPAILESLNLPDKNLGIVAYDYIHSLRILAEASKLSLFPGKDFGLASCDATGSIFSIWPDLSRSYVSRFDMGADAAEILIEAIKNEDKNFNSKLITPTFIKGKTA